jgi:ATP-binding cassette, subfamily B, bacterial
VTREPADADLRRAFAYLAPYWRRLVLVMAISLVSTGLSLISPYLTKDLVDRALIGRDLVALQRTVALFAALGVMGYVLNVVSGLRYTRVSAEILFDMRLALYRHLQRLSPRFYARTRLGDIVARINGDIGEIQRVAAEAALAWVGNILFLIGCTAMLVWLDWKLAVVTAAIMPLSLLALVFYRRRLEARVATLRQRSADIGSFLIETLQAHTLVVASNAQDREVSRFRRLNDRFIAALMGMQRLSYLAGGLPGVLLSLGGSLVFLYGGWRVVEGTLTLGTFAAFIAYQMRVMAPVQALMGLYTAVATAKVSWRRVLELLDAPVDVQEAADARALAEVRGDVAFEHVSLSTERGLAVLDDVSFTVAAGTSVALVGASGSGKSTMAALLLRLLDPDTRRRPGRWPRPPPGPARRSAPPRRAGGAGADPAAREHRREPPLRPHRERTGRAGRRRRGHSPCRRGGRHQRVHRRTAAALRHGGRRTRPAVVGRRAAAAGAGPSLPRQPIGAGARRADRSARSDRGAGGGGRLSRGDARADDHHHLAPS